MKKQPLFVARFDNDWTSSMRRLLDAAGFAAVLQSLSKPILIKPNLVTTDAPPITTPVSLVEAIVDFIRSSRPETEIIIGEGCGSLDYETAEPFKRLGYVDLAERKSLALVDLNHAPLTTLSDPRCLRFPTFHMPKIVLESYVVSVPVLKAHSFSEVTLTMKTMLGVAPPRHYNAGGWQKSAFHTRIHEAILDLNRYRTPDFTVLDATIGMKDAHLWGAVCSPPPNQIVAGFDPVAIDAYGATLLKRDWRRVDHIRLADGVLGFGDPERIMHSFSGK